MSRFPDYARYDGLALAELVRRRAVTPSDLLEEAISRIEALNPRFNAVVTRMYDAARREIARGVIEGPFGGVPMLVKDLLADCAGVPTSAGNRLLKNVPAAQDAEIVTRYRRAGAVILGKANTPEFGLVPFTEPEVFGPTRNPWDPSRTVGGSSGGPAASVAARMVPIAGGGDGGGSIRIPASCCGVFGLKPTRGRTPSGPEHGEHWRGFVVEHVLTRSVRDSAAMLDAIAGPDVGAPYFLPAPARPFLDEVAAEPGRLRVAFTTTPLLGTQVHADCVAGVAATAELLQSLGHEVVEACPHIDREAFAVAFLTIVAAEARADIEWAASKAGRPVSKDGFEGATYALGLVGKGLGAADYAGAARYLQRSARDVGRFFETCDVLLTPTVSQPPFEIGALQARGADKALIRFVGATNAGWLLRAAGAIDKLAAQTFEFMPYTPVFNVTGQPAMSVPLHSTAAGLPIGMHFVGRFGDEATLFRLAGQLERARPWIDRVPPGC